MRASGTSETCATTKKLDVEIDVVMFDRRSKQKRLKVEQKERKECEVTKRSDRMGPPRHSGVIMQIFVNVDKCKTIT